MANKAVENPVSKESVEEQDDAELDQYISGIGDRIRAMRTSRGMIRKDLSRQSGVSERYIAQVETGKANISIAMLWKIAQSMGVRIPELFPDCDTRSANAPLLLFLSRLDPEQQEAALALLKRRFGKSNQQIQGVALIGLRGAGKSSLGRMLADEFGVRFVQVSELIEQYAQMSTAELFSLGGQKAYRRMEMQALEEVLAEPAKIVLETGGSLVTQPESFKLLLDAYYTVWIKTSPEEHMNRVLAQGDLRPMSGSDNDEAMEDLKLILKEREMGYSQADYILDTSQRSLLDCAQELANQCGDYLAK
jgi:XRE family aerobic/anaerobic benzoate catabolism transcriptional regulator